MDDFVCNKLTEWGLSEWIDTFKDRDINEERFRRLNDQDLNRLITEIGPRTKFKEKLKLLKEHEEKAKLPQFFAPTIVKAKRPLDRPGDSSKQESPAKRLRDNPEATILSEVKNIMNSVRVNLRNQDDTKLNDFLKTKIKDLETDKRELVGVVGRSGAGKSSLINAIIGEDLLPTGSISACTTVMIKVETNMNNSEYEADIEFITKEEWREELRVWDQLRGDNTNQEDAGGDDGGDAEGDDDDDDDEEDDDGDEDDEDDDDDSYDFDEKLSALYGEEYKNKTSEELMDDKYFEDVKEFLHSRKKTSTYESATELSEELVKYTRSEPEEGEGEEVKRLYWPLVKCVTVKVPENEFLQHVTLVDLPGNGYCNKSRDQMWKRIVRDCSTVWIVTDINRAESEPEPWEILENASSLMGNGGECQQIHFICTKSDVIGDVDVDSVAEVHARILKRNECAKKKVETKFKKQKKIQKQFSGDRFEVFTVSSKEFLKGKYLQPDETEIPKLQKVLRDLNDHHSETLNYVSGAQEILSLIQGAHLREGAVGKTKVHADLKQYINHQLDKVKTTMEEANKAFENCLSEGVEKSKSSCEKKLKSFLSSKKGSAFHGILKSVVKKGGVYTTKNGEPINLNKQLSSHLKKSIDNEFRKNFPNNREYELFNGIISKIPVVTDAMILKYKGVKLQLNILETEGERMKTKLIPIIQNRKKMIYNSLTETIKKDMKECYDRADKCTGKGTLKDMRDIILEHVEKKKNVMFDHAKDVMLKEMNQLKEDILKEVERTMMKAIEYSVKIDDSSIPDVSTELQKVEKIYDGLKAQKKKSN